MKLQNNLKELIEMFVEEQAQKISKEIETYMQVNIQALHGKNVYFVLEKNSILLKWVSRENNQAVLTKFALPENISDTTAEQIFAEVLKIFEIPIQGTHTCQRFSI